MSLGVSAQDAGVEKSPRLLASSHDGDMRRHRPTTNRWNRLQTWSTNLATSPRRSVRCEDRSTRAFAWLLFDPGCSWYQQRHEYRACKIDRRRRMLLQQSEYSTPPARYTGGMHAAGSSTSGKLGSYNVSHRPYPVHTIRLSTMQLKYRRFETPLQYLTHSLMLSRMWRLAFWACCTAPTGALCYSGWAHFCRDQGSS